MKGQAVCNRCGKKFEDPSHGIEVEYKDFKLSEFLEIRSKERKDPARMPEIIQMGARPEEETGKQGAGYRPGIHEERRPLPLLIALAFLLLALLASVFLIWRLYTH